MRVTVTERFPQTVGYLSNLTVNTGDLTPYTVNAIFVPSYLA